MEDLSTTEVYRRRLALWLEAHIKVLGLATTILLLTFAILLCDSVGTVHYQYDGEHPSLTVSEDGHFILRTNSTEVHSSNEQEDRMILLAYWNRLMSLVTTDRIIHGTMIDSNGLYVHRIAGVYHEDIQPTVEQIQRWFFDPRISSIDIQSVESIEISDEIRSRIEDIIREVAPNFSSEGTSAEISYRIGINWDSNVSTFIVYSIRVFTSDGASATLVFYALGSPDGLTGLMLYEDATTNWQSPVTDTEQLEHIVTEIFGISPIQSEHGPRQVKPPITRG